LNSCTVSAFCGCVIAGLLKKFLKFVDSSLEREPLVAAGMEFDAWVLLMSPPMVMTERGWCWILVVVNLKILVMFSLSDVLGVERAVAVVVDANDQD
jgi:hypothetical protein